ncbi:hypothetical protein UCRPC4_g06320 [Phaeomoniella chlamydospora]|uniref:Uncharacterized protein n=1 Tax=Phaeomoniella chlamydospora TaxID=158046 RepID=A0A0G2DX91_PHACM|nr:hypothetical protein UCRPC4_g06320 [Phaeomoniella chlamydospora]
MFQSQAQLNILLKICLSPFKFAWKIAWKTIWGAIGINKAVPIVFLGYCLYTLGVFLRFLADILRTNHEPLEPLEDGRVGERLYQSPGQNEHDVETGFRILDRRDAIEAAASGNAGDVHAQRSLNNGLEGVRSGLSTEASTDRSEPNDNGPSTPVQQISDDAIQGPTRYRRGSVTDSLLPEESQDFQSSGSASDHDMEQDNAPNVMPSGTDTDVDQTYDPRGSMPLASTQQKTCTAEASEVNPGHDSNFKRKP